MHYYTAQKLIKTKTGRAMKIDFRAGWVENWSIGSLLIEKHDPQPVTKNLVSPTLKDFGTADIWRCAKAAGVTLVDTFSPQG